MKEENTMCMLRSILFACVLLLLICIWIGCSTTPEVTLAKTIAALDDSDHTLRRWTGDDSRKDYRTRECIARMKLATQELTCPRFMCQ